MRKVLTTYWLLAVLFFATVLMFLYAWEKTSIFHFPPFSCPHAPLLIVGGNVFLLTIAHTPDERALGLSGVTFLPEHDGKLFVFQEIRSENFWMKDMHFPIDIIWFDSGLAVISVTPSIATSTYPNLFMSPANMLYALEINKGQAAQKGIESGMSAHLLICPITKSPNR